MKLFSPAVGLEGSLFLLLLLLSKEEGWSTRFDLLATLNNFVACLKIFGTAMILQDQDQILLISFSKSCFILRLYGFS